MHAVYAVYITETTNYLILTHYRLHATPFLLTPLLRTFFFPHLFTGIPWSSLSNSWLFRIQRYIAFHYTDNVIE